MMSLAIPLGRNHTGRTYGPPCGRALIVLLVANVLNVHAQSPTFAGNAQHTAQYPVRAQHLNRVLWSTSVDTRAGGAGNSHYGAPLITASNTIIVPKYMGNGHWNINAFEGGTGRLKYTLTNDYTVLASPSWLPVYQPVLVPQPAGLRLYYPGAGGTVYYVENPDSDTPGPPTQICFYTNLTGYATNAAAYNNSLFICTPLTASTNGEIFFAYRNNGTIPAPLSTNRSGFVRIDAAGNGSYVLDAVAVGSTSAASSPLNCAPALSNDGATVFVVSGHYLLGLDSQTLATMYVRNIASGPIDISTASTTIGPDGDIYLGIGPGSGGPLVHFSGDLATNKVNGYFGWDYTEAVVPSSMVPAYLATSAYLLFSKYNDYTTRNRIALLDPNTPQYRNGVGICMCEVLTAWSPRTTEWCLNTVAVNPASGDVLAPNEDGRLYRWDLAANSFSEVLQLNAGVSEPYVPTCIGPDGAVYTINGGTLFALGQFSNLDVTISSSAPNLTTVVTQQPITFTATVTNVNPTDPIPTGTVTFQDLIYAPSAVTNTLAANLALSNYTASVTVSNLSINSHFVTALYSGDTNYPATRITMCEKIHARATKILVTSSLPYPGSNVVTFVAKVSSDPTNSTIPTGMTSIWDGTNFVWQGDLNAAGQTSVTITNFPPGPHAIFARYVSDATYAASSGAVTAVPATIDELQVLNDGTFVLGFTNLCGAPFTVLSSTDAAVPLSQWTVLGQAGEVFPGQFQYSDALAFTRDASRFYRLRSP